MRGLNRLPLILALLLAVVATSAAAESPNEWHQWGGPNRDFQASSQGLAAAWPESGPAKIWSRELGDGYSTILVDGGNLYTMYRGGDKEHVVCLNAKTGKTVWDNSYDHSPAANHVSQFGDGPRATPLIVGDRLYAIGVAGRMHSINLKDGKTVWSKDLWSGEEGTPLQHGYSSSPIAYGDLIIALAGRQQAKITAYKKDGSVAWESEPYGNTYSSPQVLNVGGQDQIVTFMSGTLVAVHPKNGETLWTFDLGNQGNVNMPIFLDGEYLFVSTLQDGARGLRLTQKGGKTEVEEVWSTRKIQFYHVTTVNQGDWVYGVTGARAPHFVAAVNIKTGEIAWRERGFAKSNVVAVDGKLIILEENGNLHLASASPEAFNVHSGAKVLEEVAWTAPTIVGNTMYLRDKTQIMAVNLGNKG